MSPSSGTLRGRSVFAVVCVALVAGVSAGRADAANCPSFKAGTTFVATMSTTNVGCRVAMTDLKRAIAARRGRRSWRCAGFAWTKSGTHIYGRSGSRRIRATLG